jgi:hypothetical protein
MKKEKADPQHPPLKDLQGHSYQHELGDPDAAQHLDDVDGRGDAEHGANEDGKNAPEQEGPHRMEHQQHKAKAGKSANVKLPKK